MNLSDLIAPQRVVCCTDVSSKKRSLELLGNLIAADQTEIDAGIVFDSLVGRERLGSTGLGHGVALPHGRLVQSQQAVGAFLKLEHGIDFDANDQQSVDLLFGLLVPEHYTDEHLKILAHLAEMFDDENFCAQLRAADSDQTLYALLTDWHTADD